MKKQFWYTIDENGIHPHVSGTTLIDDTGTINFMLTIKSDKIKVKYRRGCDNVWARSYWIPNNKKAYLHYCINDKVHKLKYDGKSLTIDGIEI